jgi:hypothetical protein
MFSDLVKTYHHYHQEYTRRHVSLPEPLDQPRHGLKETIGYSLIHLGERLAKVDRAQSVDEAA